MPFFIAVSGATWETVSDLRKKNQAWKEVALHSLLLLGLLACQFECQRRGLAGQQAGQTLLAALDPVWSHKLKLLQSHHYECNLEGLNNFLHTGVSRTFIFRLLN